MNDQSTNLRFLLWQKNVPRKEWLQKVANWFNGDLQRAREILNNETITKKELDFFMDNFHHNEDEIMEILEGDLLSKHNIWIFRENFLFLLEKFTIEGHRISDVISKIGINLSTYTRIKNNERKNPNSITIKKIRVFFGINQDTDLNDDPIFLNMEPIGIVLQKQWLSERIDKISGTEFQRLFPGASHFCAKHKYS
ncbi:MAG: hypothetical protein VKL42_01560 [Snowella sp.]|nr:hypothetical protein [Snowella sp.]